MAREIGSGVQNSFKNGKGACVNRTKSKAPRGSKAKSRGLVERLPGGHRTPGREIGQTVQGSERKEPSLWMALVVSVLVRLRDGLHGLRFA